MQNNYERHVLPPSQIRCLFWVLHGY